MLTLCEDIKKLHQIVYEPLMNYIDSKIKQNYLNGYVDLDEDEVLQFKISFINSAWRQLIMNAGYKIKRCDCVTPTIRIYGWKE